MLLQQNNCTLKGTSKHLIYKSCPVYHSVKNSVKFSLYMYLLQYVTLYAQPNQGYFSTVPGRCYEVKAYYLEDVLKM